MRSKSTYNLKEIEELVLLIKEKLNSEPQKQKLIRKKIRGLGFYASDYNFQGGYTVNDFLSVANINSQEKDEINGKKNIYSVKSTKQKNNNRSKSDEFTFSICVTKYSELIQLGKGLSSF